MLKSRPPSGGQGTAAWLGWGEARRLSRGLGVLAPCGSRPQRDDSKQPRRLCRLVPESQRRHPGCLLWAQSSIQAPLERKTGSTLGMPWRTQTLDPERKGRGGRCQTRIAVWATTPGPLARAPLVLPSTPAQKSPGSAPSRRRLQSCCLPTPKREAAPEGEAKATCLLLEKYPRGLGATEAHAPGGQLRLCSHNTHLVCKVCNSVASVHSQYCANTSPRSSQNFFTTP